MPNLLVFCAKFLTQCMQGFFGMIRARVQHQACAGLLWVKMNCGLFFLSNAHVRQNFDERGHFFSKNQISLVMPSL